jgi:ABC-type polysaccharide/polyol phosphate export permease
MSQAADSLTREQVVSGGPVSAVVQTIRPLKRRVRLADIVRSWPVARVVAIRDFKLLYKQAALGPIWLLLQPLAVLAAFTVAFDGVANVDTKGVPYVLFALVGITVWTYTSAVIATGVRSQLVNMRLIQFVDLPRIAFVTATIVSSLPILLVPLAFTFATMFFVDHGLTLAVLCLPAALTWLLALLYALTLGLSALNVRFRDVKALIPLFLQGGLFLTPLGYPLSAVPDNLALILSLNPFTGVVEFWRWCLLGISPELTSIWTGLAGTAVIAIAGWRVFTRLEVRFADLI